MRFWSSLINVWKIPDLRGRVLFTLGLLIIYRLGGLIPVPGVDTNALRAYFSQSSNDLFNLYNLFVGGAFSHAAVFALGIMPYISASIIIQLMGSIVPSIAQLQKDGQEGRNKLTQWTRYLTVGVAALQASGVAIFLLNVSTSNGGSIVLDAFRTGAGRAGFTALTILTLTTGTLFVMYLGEQITARGIGNGTSLIIFMGIVGRIPAGITTEYQLWSSGEHSFFNVLIVIALIWAIVAFIILVDQGIRRIPLQSPKRVVGRREMGGASSFLPLKVNTAGVIPVIFASSIVFVPSTLASFFPEVPAMQEFARLFLPGHWAYSIFFATLVIFFAYFYTAIQYNPNDIADNLKKSGAFIPGIRPGKKTSEFVDYVLTRITLPGAIFLAVISVGPHYLKDYFHMSFYIGGTSVLICVGVALETLRQLESHLMTRNYEGFLSKGRLRGRRGY
jgi:preprotein translocase subunit SecY